MPKKCGTLEQRTAVSLRPSCEAWSGAHNAPGALSYPKALAVTDCLSWSSSGTLHSSAEQTSFGTLAVSFTGLNKNY